MIGDPVISVDAKKKELVGHFKNPGQTWWNAPPATFDHDFHSLGEGKIVAFGIYDFAVNYGFMYVGTSHETPMFVVEGIVVWWAQKGRALYNAFCLVS